MRASFSRTTLSFVAFAVLFGQAVRSEEPTIAEPASAFDGTRSLVGSYLAGRIARSEADTNNAAKFYRGALERDPGSEMLLEQAFQMEALEGLNPRTIELAEQLIASDPQHRTAHLFLGLRDFEAGSYEKALQHFRAASTGPIGELTGAMAQAWVEQARGNTSAALMLLDQSKQAEWAQFYLRYHKALIADLAGRKQDARSAYEHVFRQDPKSLRTTLAFVRSAAHAGDIKLARSILKQHVDRSQGEAHPLVRSLLAELNVAGVKPDLIVKTAADGLAEAFYGLGEVLIGEGVVPAGTLYMQMALSVVPDQQFALAALANAYESSKRYDDAISIYNRIPKGSPLELPIEIRKAYNLNSLDRSDEARQTLSTLLDRMSAYTPSAPVAEVPEASGAEVDVSSFRPLRLGSKGEDVKALQEALIKEGFAEEPADGRFGEGTRRAVMAFQKAKGLAADGKAGPETVRAILSGAEPAAETVSGGRAMPVGLAPSVADQLQVLDALGSIQRSRKLFSEATDTYTRALNLVPKIEARHWALYYARGTSYERLKNWPAAEADLKKALELAPDQPLVLNYLGYSWIDQGLHLKGGMDLIEKAVSLKPDDGFIVDSLGWAHFRLGNYNDAVRYLERAVELRPDDPILNDHLGDALWKVGREREARFQWDQALSLNPEPEDLERIKKKVVEGLEAKPAAEKKTTEVQPPTLPTQP